MGANCIYAKDILPPEFYQAISSNNSKDKSKPVYLIQNVAAPEKISKADWERKAKIAVNALNGKGTYTLSGSKTAMKYFIRLR